uniref:Charged multivesicular body protein 7 n=1 Tax=Acrobeloides nanus TaxID=290746 RepID=A0A914C8I5_9BILA
MVGLMSQLKARHVNPTNYDRVTKFWTNLIDDYCKYERTCVVTCEELKKKFRRGAQIPSPLSTILQEMCRDGTIQSAEDLKRRSQGWLQWGMSFLNPASWLNGKNQEEFNKMRLVHIPTLKKLADDLLEFYKVEFEMADCPEVVGFDELRERSSNIIKDEECFEFVIDELTQRGEVSLGTTKSGDKVLKFKDQGSRGPAKFTDTDASVHEIRRSLSKLESEIKRLETREKSLQEEARLAVRKGDRKSALNILRRKKRAEKDLHDKDIQCQRLLSMLEQLVQTKQTREIIDIYKTSTQAFKASLARQGLTVENIDETIDSVQDVMDDYKEIEDALSEGIKMMPSAATIDEGELEAELNEILEGDKKAKEAASAKAEIENRVKVGQRVIDLNDLPEVPSHVPPKADKLNGKSLEERWRKLRETAQ